jgi:predicted N-acetyltransferase YhbS
MSIKFRFYNDPADYSLVDDFLIQYYQPDNADGNWLEPAWEYMHAHPYLDNSSLGKIGVWEDAGKIVAVVHYESVLGEAFFEFDPDHHHLRQGMLDYAEDNLYGRTKADERRYLKAYVNDNDKEFASLVRGRGYEKVPDGNRPLAKYVIPGSFPSILLPEGFLLKSLADDCDWAKVHRVMWRGFNNKGEPPGGAEELESRRKLFETPKARRDLKIVVEAPNGDFASFCGMWYEPANKYAYVEPVATDLDYRRMGLGKAAVLEGIRRCGELGAKVAYVGSDQEFYLALGFEVIFTSECWVKFFD